MVRHAPIHRRSGHSDIAICCGRNVRGSSPSTSVVPLSNQVTTLNHKRFKGFKMFSDGHSGISVCGVSAAIATGGAIRARPIVAVMVSSLVVVFAVVELLILPFAAAYFLDQQPMAAGAWMALSVKTDGAAVASGGITEALILANAAAQGIKYQPGWILGTAATLKVFIDIFIGVWAFLLAWIWTKHIDVRKGDTPKIGEISQRFPKFIIGYVVTFLIILFMALAGSAALAAQVKTPMFEANAF